MPTLKDRILELLKGSPGLTDRQLADALAGPFRPQQPFNQACRALERRGHLIRRLRPDGLIGNFPSDRPPRKPGTPARPSPGADPLSEDSVKEAVDSWLREQGWQTTVAWHRSRGIDIDARRPPHRWIIEAKGRGGSPQEQGNYFLAALAELVQRMSDPAARYSLALPDIPRYRGLWHRLPVYPKDTLKLSVLFVDERGGVREAKE